MSDQSIPYAIVQLHPSDWQLYRAIRLEALQDSPQAFGSVYRDQVEYPASFWQNRLEQAQTGQESWLLFAQQQDQIVGLIGAFREKEQPATATVISVYVSPACRGLGVGKALLDAILDRLHAAGIKTALLGVCIDQVPALNLYRSYGFEVIAIENNPMGDGLVHTEYMMQKLLEEK